MWHMGVVAQSVETSLFGNVRRQGGYFYQLSIPICHILLIVPYRLAIVFSIFALLTRLKLSSLYKFFLLDFIDDPYFLFSLDTCFPDFHCVLR